MQYPVLVVCEGLRIGVLLLQPQGISHRIILLFFEMLADLELLDEIVQVDIGPEVFRVL